MSVGTRICLIASQANWGREHCCAEPGGCRVRCALSSSAPARKHANEGAAAAYGSEVSPCCRSCWRVEGWRCFLFVSAGFGGGEDATSCSPQDSRSEDQSAYEQCRLRRWRPHGEAALSSCVQQVGGCFFLTFSQQFTGGKNTLNGIVGSRLTLRAALA